MYIFYVLIATVLYLTLATVYICICHIQVLRENLAIHLEAQVRQHLDLACRKLATANLKVTELCKQLEPQDQRMQVGKRTRTSSRD